MKRQRFYRLVCFAQNTDIQKRGKNSENPRLANNGKSITCTVDNFVPLVAPRLSSYSSSNLYSISRSTDQSNCSRKLGTLSSPVTTRSDKHACGKPMLTDPDKQVMENREPAHNFFQTRCTKTIQRKAFQIGYSPSQLISRTWRCMCSHMPLKERTQNPEGDASKVGTQKWKHSTHTNLGKDRKRSIPRKEEIGDMKTVDRESESRNNHQFAAVVQDLTIQWILPV